MKDATFVNRALPEKRRLAALLFVASLSACAGPPPMAKLTFLTTEPALLSGKMLRERVTAEWCFSENVISVSLRPPWRARLADHGRAIQRALDRVPGADFLTDVSLEVRVEQYLLFQRICAIATGDARKLE